MVLKRTKLRICLDKCHYPSVRRVCGEIGMKIVEFDQNWDINWSDGAMPETEFNIISSWQKMNHFFGMNELCRKDYLAINLDKLARIFPDDYNFYPRTRCVSFHQRSLEDYGIDASTKNSMFICKPVNSSLGRGIFLSKKLVKQVDSDKKYIVQDYIAKPRLLDGYKFDLRIYALLMSYDPLRIYRYDEGLARLATVKYKTPSKANENNIMMHLTNYAIQSKSENFIHDEETGMKRRLTSVMQSLEQDGVNVCELQRQIDDIIIKTLIAPYKNLKHIYNVSFPLHTKVSSACFEVLGFDIILDSENKPYLLEVNRSPSLLTDEKIDMDVKDTLIKDTLTMLNVNTNKWKLKEIEDDRRKYLAVHGGFARKYVTLKNDSNYSEWIDSLYADQIKWESDHLGGYRKIYPLDDQQINHYKKFMLDWEDIRFKLEKKQCRQQVVQPVPEKEVEQEKIKPPQIERPSEVRSTDSKYDNIVRSGLLKAITDLVLDVQTKQNGDF